MRNFKIYNTYKEFKEDFNPANYEWLNKEGKGKFIKTFSLEKYITYYKNHVYFLKNSIISYIVKGLTKEERVAKSDVVDIYDFTEHLNIYDFTEDEVNDHTKYSDYYMRSELPHNDDIFIMYYLPIMNYISYDDDNVIGSKWWVSGTKYKVHLIACNKIISELEEMLLFHCEEFGYEKKEIKTEKNLLQGKKLNYSERYKILDDISGIDKLIRGLNILDREKYKLLSLILGCNSTNARHIMNGKYPAKIKDDLINNYLKDLKK